MGKKRPEEANTAANFYNEVEAEKYTQNSRIIHVQSEMTERAIELLLNRAEDKSTQLILDVGCGSCISGDILSEHGYNWIGMDISRPMLGMFLFSNIKDVARKGNEHADLVQSDMGDGVPFRFGVFDGCISVSALQWLCHAETAEHDPLMRMRRFFSLLYQSLKNDARAVLQFYPESPAQVEILTKQAMKAGFRGGVLVDFPNSAKAKKMYLVLNMPDFSGEDASEKVNNNGRIEVETRQSRLYFKNGSEKSGKFEKKSKEWIMQKKQKHRQVGKRLFCIKKIV